MAEGIAELGIVFNKLLSDYGMLRNSLKEIENQSQNIRILSFNSSIEAARAGNAGKGFHIISQEIRKSISSIPTVLCRRSGCRST